MAAVRDATVTRYSPEDQFTPDKLNASSPTAFT